jgi:hypothetical protein
MRGGGGDGISSPEILVVWRAGEAGHTGNPGFCECSCCDYTPPVCGPGSGHNGQGRFDKGTQCPRDASFKEKRTGTLRSAKRRH